MDFVRKDGILNTGCLQMSEASGKRQREGERQYQRMTLPHILWPYVVSLLTYTVISLLYVVIAYVY